MRNSVDVNKLQVYVPNHTTPVLSIYSQIHVSDLIAKHHQTFNKVDTEKLHTALRCRSLFTLEIHYQFIKPFTCILNMKDGQPWNACLYINMYYQN
jgi:hypothetical protein